MSPPSVRKSRWWYNEGCVNVNLVSSSIIKGGILPTDTEGCLNINLVCSSNLFKGGILPTDNEGCLNVNLVLLFFFTQCKPCLLQ